MLADKKDVIVTAAAYKVSPGVIVEAVGFEYLVLHRSTGAVQRLENGSAVALREVLAGRDPHSMGLGDVLEILVDLRIVEPVGGAVSRRKLLGLSAAAAGVGIVTITMPQALAASSTEDDDISGLAAPDGFVSSTSGITINNQSTSGGIGLDADGNTQRTDGYFYSSARVANFPGSFQVRLTVVGGSGAVGGAFDGVAGRGAIVIAVVNVDQWSNDRLDLQVGGMGTTQFGGQIGFGGTRVGGTNAFDVVDFRNAGNGGNGGGAASIVSRPTGATDPLLVIAGGGGGGGRGSEGSPGGYGGHSGRNGSAGEQSALGWPTAGTAAGGGGGGLQNGTGGAAGVPDYGRTFEPDPPYFKHSTPGGNSTGVIEAYQTFPGQGGQGGTFNAYGGGGGSGFTGGGGGGSGSSGAGGGGGSSWTSDGSASFGLRATTGAGYIRMQLKQIPG